MQIISLVPNPEQTLDARKKWQLARQVSKIPLINLYSLHHALQAVEKLNKLSSVDKVFMTFVFNKMKERVAENLMKAPSHPQTQSQLR